jgi:hypothetical protein
MSRRNATLAIVGLVGASILLVVAWSLAQARQRPTRTSPGSVQLAPGLPGSGISFGPTFGLGLEPRLFVTLCERTGPFLVSVRQIWTADRRAGLLLPHRGAEEALGPCTVVLQVLQPGGPEPPTYRVDTRNLRVYDSLGRLLEHKPVVREGREMTPIGGGAFCAIDIAPPAGASLSRIEGAVLDAGTDGRERSYPFVLSEVPLPNTHRVFGDIAVHYLPTEQAARYPEDLVVLGSEATRKLLPALTKHPESGLLPRQRILLALEKPGRIRQVLAGVPDLRLRADRSDFGAIVTEAEVQGRTWRGTLWSGDPHALIAPGLTGGRRAVFLVRLRRIYEEPLLTLTTPSAFPAQAREAGGSITSYILANGQRVTRAMFNVRVFRVNGPLLDGPKTMRVSLDDDGVMTLPNLRPGRYLLLRQPEKLEPSAVLPDEEVMAYLNARYGLRGGAWVGRAVEVEVRAGARVAAPPLEWRSGPDAIALAAREAEALRLRGIALGPRVPEASLPGS